MPTQPASDGALTPHIHLAELTASPQGDRAGLCNEPKPAHLLNLQRLAELLEQVRSLLGNRPITVSSGFRSPAVNKLVGGAHQSQHLDGLAADFICPAFGTPRQICEAIAAAGHIQFDQLIDEGGRWVHISLALKSGRPRRAIATAVFVKGLKAQYLQGLV